jgi:hypothetical protein
LIVIADSEALANAFELDFEQLWRSGTVAGSGDVDPEPIQIGESSVRAWFVLSTAPISRIESPGRSDAPGCG